MSPGLPPAPTSEHHKHNLNSSKSWENTCAGGVQELDAREHRAAHAAMDLDGGHCLHVVFLCCGAIQRFVFLGNERLGCCQGFQHLLAPQKLL